MRKNLYRRNKEKKNKNSWNLGFVYVYTFAGI